MNDEDRKKYHQIFVDCWRLFLKYQNPQRSYDQGQIWKNFQEDAHEVYERHGQSEFAKELLLAVYGELGKIEDAGGHNE